MAAASAIIFVGMATAADTRGRWSGAARAGKNHRPQDGAAASVAAAAAVLVGVAS